MKNLVIVESPTKARTIGRFLGPDYDIQASMGHIMDLPKSKLGVDVDHNFEPLYEVVGDKKKIIAALKASAKTAENIILATDPDREGEAIAAHVKEVLTLKGNEGKFKRIVFHEITKEAIEEAFTHSRAVDTNLVDAQTARRVLDRLVGYKLSPLLWEKVRRGLSAGRVQSVALRLIVEREREIGKFTKEPYYTITAVFEKVPFELIEIDGNLPRQLGVKAGKIESQSSLKLYDGDYSVTKTTLVGLEQAEKLLADVKIRSYAVADVIQKEAKRSPAAPYTTSTLQQDASRKLGFAGKRTMSVAQKLYEEGFITYHRTDSVTMSVSAVVASRDYIVKTFGEKYVPEKPRAYMAKQKLAQEAHEAIRPTKFGVMGDAVTADLGRDFGRLYELIWRRATASQMSDAIIESTTVLVHSIDSHPGVATTTIGSPDSIASLQNDSPRNYRFKANGSVLVFEGFLKINPQALGDNKLPVFKAQQDVDLLEAHEVSHETPPPPRYNDASLIKTLEEKGIGRPSTYASIISTIETRRYIERVESRFIPTPVGMAVTDFLVTNFADIDDIPFTANMEDELDLVASGEKKWAPMMKAFYEPFEKKLKEVKGDAKRVKIATEMLDEACPECKSPLVIRIGRFGKFISCSTFPDCKFTKPFVEETGVQCPKDDGMVIIKKTRKGRKFFGCSNYPSCTFAAWKLEDIKKEPAVSPEATTNGA